VPETAVEAFAGLSCLPCLADPPPAARVLDLGCGAGLDSLLIAPRVASVLGVDFSAEMVARARAAAAAAGARNVEFREGDAEAIPAAPASVDAALVNGLFNLNPARQAIFGELARVVRPGGAVYAAELVLAGPAPAAGERSDADWFT
jgi:ubiquinone/menaquinone biosynthesis C-methylase UbiE